MSSSPIPRVEVDGRAASTEQLTFAALVNYGHFTAMQVRNGKVRGLELHLRRLAEANRELFDATLDGDRIRDHIRHALADDAGNASVRVHVFCPPVFCPPAGDVASVMVVVYPPRDMPGIPRTLQSVPYQRAIAHIKHLGDFGQAYHLRQAERAGFDDALLTGPGGVIAEGGATNVGFFDGASIIWPDAPALAGTTMQLLEPRLIEAGLPSGRGPVHLADLASFAGVFATNSRGIAPVGRVDDQPLPVHPGLMKTVAAAYDGVPWDRI